MREVNLRSVDLNLLVVLQALLEERHVSRAADRLGMSQPAVSRALQRLRGTFDDPLLVRTASGYDLSARGHELLPRLSALLQGVNRLIAAPRFDPATADDVVRISGLDLELALYIPPISKRLHQVAPNLRLELQPLREDPFQLLDSGEVHFTMTGLQPTAGVDQLHRMVVDRMDPVCLMDRHNPLAVGPLTVDSYAQALHGLVSITGRGPGIMDDKLAALGRSRRVMRRLASFMPVADFCEGTDLIFTLPQRLAEHIARGRALVLREVPKELKQREIIFYMYWHARHHQDPMCAWVRGQIAEVLRETVPPVAPPGFAR
ncbi:LysR family transcriptional regulator [Marinobacterium arenosum]|uniref:LysR family transcriptional regulator n=1 Tax=Marinobacterium arenosum TaxID=2862496 RepID=UPI001C966B2B|nr:LysR family transcriptional regulator [Marinobacterium arenosum]MBY4678101.1 LysR family transcriptional regulator [Marinobacterium arenosum]